MTRKLAEGEGFESAKGGQALLGRSFTRLRRASLGILMAQPHTTLTGFQKLLPGSRSRIVRKLLCVEKCECANDLRALRLVVPMFNKSSLQVVCDSHVPLASGSLKYVDRSHDTKTGGGGGIRTLECLAALLVFETSPFNHSGTHPKTAVSVTHRRRARKPSLSRLKASTV